jgi:transposase
MTDSTEAHRPRRRRYDEAFKRALVEQTLTPGASVARIAREHGINANLLFNWRRRYRHREQGQGAPAAQVPSAVSMLPVTVVADEALASPESPSRAGKLEIRLAGGTVRIEGAVDVATLQLVLASLRR